MGLLDLLLNDEEDKKKKKKDLADTEYTDEQLDDWGLDDIQKEQVKEGYEYPWSFEEEDKEDDDYYKEDDD